MSPFRPPEDTNGNGVLDPGEDVGLIRRELTLAEFNNGSPERNVTYGAGNGVIDQETGPVVGTSRYHANSNGGLYDDEDDTCYAADQAYTTNGYTTVDWSTSGGQW